MARRAAMEILPTWIHVGVWARCENRVDARWRDADRARVPHPSSSTDRVTTVTTVRLARRAYHVMHLAL